MNLFFSGEGSDELGDWAGHPAYHPRSDGPGEGGLLQALARRFTQTVIVADAWTWRHVRKFRVGKHDAPETQTVLGLALRASELECKALVFVRDRDRDPEREKAIELGIQKAEQFPVGIVGGTANEEIEAWLLAMLGDTKAERHADPKTVLSEKHGIEDRAAKIAVVEGAALEKLPNGCESLTRWLRRAQEHLKTAE